MSNTKNNELATIKARLAAAPLNQQTHKENLQLLQQAAAAGSLADVKFLIETQNCNILHRASPFFLAAANGQLDVVKYFVAELKIDVCLTANCFEEGLTALHLAAGNGHLNVVRYLAQQPYADIKAKGVAGITPLLMAAGSQSLDTLKFLWHSGADLNDKDAKENNLLHYAAKGGNLEIIKFLLELQNFDVDAVNVEDMSAKLMAAQNGQLKALEYFLLNGQANDINSLTNRYGDNIVTLAATHGQLNVLKYFLAYQRVDIKIKNAALAKAAKAGQAASVKLLLANVEIIAEAQLDELLFLAADNGQAAVLAMLIEKAGYTKCKASLKNFLAFNVGELDLLKFVAISGISVAERNAWQLLHYAAKHENLAVIEFLISQQHFDVNCRNEDGETPLHLAARHGKIKAIVYLAASGKLKVKLKNNAGLTPLQLAIECEHLNVAVYLIETLAAAAKASTKDGMTALLLAAAKNDLAAIKILLKCGADISDKTAWRKNAFHFAAGNGNLAAFKFLMGFAMSMAQAAVLYKGTARLKDVLHFAAHSGSLELVEFLSSLKRFRLNLTQRAEHALHFAVKSENLKLIKFLVEHEEFNAFKKYNKAAEDSPFLLAVRYGLLDIVKYFYGIAQPSLDADVKANALHLAFDYGQLHVIRYLVKEQTVNINAEKDGNTILDLAIEKRDVTMIRFLLKCGAEINYRRSRALYNAARQGVADIQQLLKHEFNFKADFEEAVDNNDTNGHLKFVEHLFQHKKMSTSSKNEDSATVLHEAVLHSDAAVVDYLVKQQKADLKAKRYDGSTALLWAAKEERTETVKQLLQMGADYDERDNDNNGFLYYANFDAGDLDFMQELLEQRVYDVNDVNGLGKLMYFAADSAHRAAVMAYLLKKMKTEKKTEFIMTILHEAAYRGDLERVDYLITELNADVNAKCPNGKTALLWAVTSESLATVQLLLANDANLEDRDNDANGIIHYAACGKSLAILSFLIEDLELAAVTKNKWGLTPLWLAAQRGVLWSIEYFVEKRGISIYEKNAQGQTVLYEAIRAGQLTIVKYLIEKQRFDTGVKDEDGILPIHYAREREEDDIVAYFRKTD